MSGFEISLTAVTAFFPSSLSSNRIFFLFLIRKKTMISSSNLVFYAQSTSTGISGRKKKKKKKKRRRRRRRRRRRQANMVDKDTNGVNLVPRLLRLIFRKPIRSNNSLSKLKTLSIKQPPNREHAPHHITLYIHACTVCSVTLLLSPPPPPPHPNSQQPVSETLNLTN